MMEIRLTADGSHTIYVPEIDDHYHSIYGAVAETEFIYINCGFRFCSSPTVRIFETGFGTGLNALLTAEKCETDGRNVFYTSIEKYPVPRKLINELNYKDFIREESRTLFEKIHKCKWEKPNKITDHFTLKKIKADFLTFEPDGKYDLIYYDAFGPDKQPEMWTSQIFSKLANMVVPGSLLVTYSVKGIVKRGLRDNGFNVSLLSGPTGKRHILRAVKI